MTDDIEDIKQLKARYFRMMDTKDWDAMRKVFAADVVVDTTSSWNCGSFFLCFRSNVQRRICEGSRSPLEMTALAAASCSPFDPGSVPLCLWFAALPMIRRDREEHWAASSHREGA